MFLHIVRITVHIRLRAIFMCSPHLHKLCTWSEAGVDFIHGFEKFGTTNIFMNAETLVNFILLAQIRSAHVSWRRPDGLNYYYQLLIIY